MTMKQKAFELAYKLDCIIEDAEPGTITLTAPDGHCFDQDVHERIYSNHPLEVKQKATYRAIYMDLQETPPEVCEIIDCEWCNERAGVLNRIFGFLNKKFL